MNEFLAAVYDKDKNVKRNCDWTTYNELKATGQWFDSHQEALEAHILKLKQEKAQVEQGKVEAENKDSAPSVGDQAETKTPAKTKKTRDK